MSFFHTQNGDGGIKRTLYDRIVLKVGKVSAAACTVKIKEVTFPNICSTAKYQEAYFTCDGTEGNEYLSIAPAAYMGGGSLKIISTACSIYGSSVANVTGMYVE